MSARRLSLARAVACEQGIRRRCRCRCGGRLHNAKRFGETPSAGHFLRLPPDDPHAVRKPRFAWKQIAIPYVELHDVR